MSDWELIQEYARSRSEVAFAELVERHLGWVYSVALRQVRDSQMAEDVAQSVFILLARKAAGFRSGTIVGGWLFRTTRFVSSRALRAERRRRKREEFAMNAAASWPENKTDGWEQLAPVLESAVAELAESDRAAILLRFYERKRMQEIGAVLGISEEAAKKRVSRAVEKLRQVVTRRGAILTGSVLVALLSGKTVMAAPVGLVGSITNAAATISASSVLPELARETLNAWRWTKLKIAAAAVTGCVAVLLLAGIKSGFLRSGGNANSAVAEQTSAPTPIGPGQPTATAANEANTNAVLSSPVALRGVVLDQNGRPVPGAKVWAGFNFDPAAEAISDASGEFALSKLGTLAFVTVAANGFAADQQSFDATNPPAQMVFRLNPTQPLVFRVVDEESNGVAAVSPFLDEWWGQRGTLGQHLPQQTDAEGRLRWLSPPRGVLAMEFGKAGYRFARTNKFVADGQEHTIVLHPAGSVSGSVTDEETGNPISSFRYTQGHAQPFAADDPVPIWDLRSQEGKEGAYKIGIEEEQTPWLRMEAEGYETVEMAIEFTSGPDAVLDFKLRKKTIGRMIRGTVRLPNGMPAGNVEVALCTAQAGVMLDGTSFEPEAFGNLPKSEKPAFRRKTDGNGQFAFDPKPGAHTVVAVGLAGLGLVRCFNHSQPLELRLEPWGRIEGDVRTREGQCANRKVYWSRPGNLTQWMTLFFRDGSFNASSDDSGHFVIQKVPPGDCRVAVSTADESGSVLSAAVHVNPGETARVQVGGNGRKVAGRLVAPENVEIRDWAKQLQYAELSPEYENYHVPERLSANDAERWKLVFEDTDAGRAWFKGRYSYEFKVAADGSFSLPEVLPGKYHLMIGFREGNLGSGGSEPVSPFTPRVASVHRVVTVPEPSGNNNSAVDLGQIMLLRD